MCLLSFIPASVLPDLAHLQNGADENPDGHGWAIVIPDERRIITGHGMNPQAVIAEFGEMRAKYPDGPALFHSRFGTGGRVDEYNCHPFTVGGDARTVVAHNGVMGRPDGARCDTRVFAEDILPNRWKRYDRPGVRRQIEHYLGFGNKIVILTVNPRYAQMAYIFNEDLGDWVGAEGQQVWHSNDGWKPAPAWWDNSYGRFSKFGSRRRYYPSALIAQETSGTGGAVYSTTWGRWADCEVCFTVYGVDPDTNICTDCNSCADCAMPSDMCDCYTPGRSAHSVPASAGTGAMSDPDTALIARRAIALAEAQERLNRARGVDAAGNPVTPAGSPAYPGVPASVATITVDPASVAPWQCEDCAQDSGACKCEYNAG